MESRVYNQELIMSIFFFKILFSECLAIFNDKYLKTYHIVYANFIFFLELLCFFHHSWINDCGILIMILQNFNL